MWDLVELELTKSLEAPELEYDTEELALTKSLEASELEYDTAELELTKSLEAPELGCELLAIIGIVVVPVPATPFVPVVGYSLTIPVEV